MKIALVIKAGGLRGALALSILTHLQNRLERPIIDCVHLVGGTSTGGIITMLLQAGYSPREILDLYNRLAGTVFPRRWFPSMRMAMGPKHDIRVLRRELGKLMPGRISDCRTPILIPTVEGRTRRAVHITRNDFWAELPMADAATATSAAQGYFRRHRVEYGGFQSEFMDGGNFSGNAADDVRSEMLNLWPGEKHMIIAVGVGRLADHKCQPYAECGLAALGEVFEVASDSQDDNACTKCDRALGRHFYDLDVPLDRVPPMDDSRPETMAWLADQGTHWAIDNYRTLDEIAATLNHLAK